MVKLVLLLLGTFIAGLVATVYNTVPVPAAITTKNYPENLPDALTGGFGEDTCRRCHFDYPLNFNEGSLTVQGLPKQYQTGQEYSFTIILKRKELRKAGFQLSSRFKNGEQAGTFIIHSKRLRFTEMDGKIQYLQHSAIGTTAQTEDSISWTINWLAPKILSKSVIFNLAANASNGDESEFGDFIFSREFEISSK